MKLRNTQLLPADVQVFAQGIHAAVHRVDQAVIDALGHFIRTQRRLAHAMIAARRSVKDPGLHLTGIQRRQRVAHFAVAVHHIAVRRLAHRPVRALKEGNKARIGQHGLFSVLAARFAQIHIRAGKHVIRVFRHGSQLGRHGHQLFLARGKRMRLHAQHAGKERVVPAERRVFNHAAEFFFIKGQKLRRKESRLRRNVAVKRLRAAVHRLIRADGRVLVLLHHRIAVHVAHLFHQRHIAVDRVQHSLSSAMQRARQGRKCLRAFLHRVKRALPSLVAFKDTRQIPRKSRIDRRAGQFLVHEHPSFKNI